MSVRKYILLPIFLSACGSIPNLPSKRAVPVSQIIHNAACEIKEALKNMSKDKNIKNFKQNEWAASISLLPSTDTDFGVHAGYTGKSTDDTKAYRYFTWTAGTSPGLEVDVKGHRDASVKYLIHSSQLFDEKKYKLDCSAPPKDAAPLAQKLGIQDYLERLYIREYSDDIATIAQPDAPSFNSEIIIKFDGGYAGGTYYISRSTLSAGLYGSNSIDERLNIAFTKDPPPIVQQTIPGGDLIRSSGVQGVSPAAKQELDRIQQQSILQNLRVVPQ
ncbi:hypothetical protein [Rhizobium rhizogenes]|uniref:hypothetical protein n=1 Tax=Rhizobium rhizogenes TaxID=359 RepID=UPI0015740B03|nr:hypothetical protein [Rhizobium rhizogenes]NTG08838.1 hypothetical protein [Rhizobium rhizogenes]